MMNVAFSSTVTKYLVVNKKHNRHSKNMIGQSGEDKSLQKESWSKMWVSVMEAYRATALVGQSATDRWAGARPQGSQISGWTVPRRHSRPSGDSATAAGVGARRPAFGAHLGDVAVGTEVGEEFVPRDVQHQVANKQLRELLQVLGIRQPRRGPGAAGIPPPAASYPGHDNTEAPCPMERIEPGYILEINT